MNYYNKHWFGITQEVAWNGRSGYWKTCLDKLPSWKAKKGPEISMKFYELPPSMCGSELLNHQCYWRNTNPNKQKETSECFSSPNVANPTFEPFRKTWIQKVNDSFHWHEPHLHRWTSRFSRLPFLDVILLEFAGLVVALFGVWRKQGGGSRFSPTATCTSHSAFLTRQFELRIGNHWEAWYQAHHNHISWRHKGSSSSYERPLKPLEPHRHVGKTCQNHIQIISP